MQIREKRMLVYFTTKSFSQIVKDWYEDKRNRKINYISIHGDSIKFVKIGYKDKSCEWIEKTEIVQILSNEISNKYPDIKIFDAKNDLLLDFSNKICFIIVTNTNLLDTEKSSESNIFAIEIICKLNDVN